MLQYLYHLSKNNKHLRILLLKDNKTLGFIYLKKYSADCWEVLSLCAQKGYGYKMNEIAMDFINTWIILDRNKQINEKLSSTYRKFIERNDIITEKIKEGDKEYVKISEENNDWFNCKYKFKNKLNLEFIKSDYKTVVRLGLKLFDQLYDYSVGYKVLE